MSGHPGERLTALVDGELDHRARERVLAHLTHCLPCRGEVEAYRRLKTVLGGLREAPPLPPPDLTARLVAVSGAAPGPPLPGAPGPTRPPAGPRGARRPTGRGALTRPGSAVLGRAGRARTAGMLLVVGLAGALALGAPASSGPAAPVDPASPVLVADHVSTSSGVPLSEPAFAVVRAGVSGPGR